jgi:hypothetical protein
MYRIISIILIIAILGGAGYLFLSDSSTDKDQPDKEKPNDSDGLFGPGFPGPPIIPELGKVF